MFYGCSSLKEIPDISIWNTDNLTEIKDMFYSCYSLLLFPDVSKWNFKNIKNINIFPSLDYYINASSSDYNSISKNNNDSISFSIINNIFSYSNNSNSKIIIYYNEHYKENEIFDKNNFYGDDLDEYYDNFYK